MNTIPITDLIAMLFVGFMVCALVYWVKKEIRKEADRIFSAYDESDEEKDHTVHNCNPSEADHGHFF